MRHRIRIARFQPECERWRAVADEVEPQQLHGEQRYRQAEHHAAEDDQDFADVAREQEVHELADVGIDHPPLLDGGDDAGEVVVGEHHVGGLLGDVGAGDAHGHADVGVLERRRVVHAVAGHRDDVATRFQRLDDARLVLRRDATAHLQTIAFVLQFGIVERLDFGPGQHQAARRQQTDLSGDGFGRFTVVTGNHDGAQSCSARHFQRLDGFGTRRVDHAEHADEDEVLLDSLRRHVFRERLHRAAGHCEHAQGLTRQVAVLFEDRRSPFGIQRDQPAGFEALCAEIKHDIGRALDEGDEGR